MNAAGGGFASGDGSGVKVPDLGRRDSGGGGSGEESGRGGCSELGFVARELSSL